MTFSDLVGPQIEPTAKLFVQLPDGTVVPVSTAEIVGDEISDAEAAAGVAEGDVVLKLPTLPEGVK